MIDMIGPFPDAEVLAGEEPLQHPDVLVPHLLHAPPAHIGPPLHSEHEVRA
jgi:hypothetical protein